MVGFEPGRREVLVGAAALAAGAAPAARAQQRQAVRWSVGDEPPRTRAPANAADCHFHIYDDSFPVAANATLRPPEAGV